MQLGATLGQDDISKCEQVVRVRHQKLFTKSLSTFGHTQGINTDEEF
jgi:hypothetical protein